MKEIRFILLVISSLMCLFAILAISGCQTTAQEPLKFTVKYETDGNGTINGEVTQTVEEGKDCTFVTAVPNEGYEEFVEWSDGLKTPKRQDTNVTADKTVKAQFKKKLPDESEIKEYTVIYKSTVGGTIEGKTVQTIIKNGSAEAVVAVPETGYKFVEWSDGITTPERQDKNVIKNQTITAKFEKLTFTVRYEGNKGKNISITTESGEGYGGLYVDFEVKYGEDCEKIIISEKTWSSRSQIFVGWADGIETRERQEKNVTSDITIRAKFGYELKYRVASGEGRIIGKTRQLIEDGEWSEPVTAVVAEGYVFSGWSDMEMETTHKLSYLMTRSQEYVVYFEPIERTFKYDYGVASPMKTEITLNREDLNEAKFEIPQREGYEFRGWYADNDYKMKVVHESGKLMLGLQTMNLETETLYARWEKKGEEKKTYKILMIMVDEINATLYSSRIEEDVLVDYKMTGVERKLCSVIPPKISQYLNKWFEGKVIFEVDTYFTREVVKKENIELTYNSNRDRDYIIEGDDITEIEDIISEYESTLVTHGLDDYDGLLHSLGVGGMAGPKHGMIYMETNCFNNYPNQNNIEAIINYNGNGEVGDGYQSARSAIVGYMHEFIHTIEQRYVYNSHPEFAQYTEEIYEFHKWSYPTNQFEEMRLYLLKQAMVDGECVGIPTSYWEEFYN